MENLECKRCGYDWERRVKVPKQCPACNSPYWMFEPGSIEDIKIKFRQLPKKQKEELLAILGENNG